MVPPTKQGAPGKGETHEPPTARMSATTTPPSADSYVNDDDAPALVDSSDDESGGYHSEEIDWSSISSPKTYPTGADIAAYRQRVQDSKSESAPVDLAKRVADLEARQGTTGHVSSPPPEPTKETKGMYARASDWFKSFKTIHHKMDNDDRTLITKTTDAIKGLPREFMAQIGEAMGLPDVESYKSFTALIGLLSDVGLMLLLDTPAQIAVHQAGMLARHGFLTTVLIDALALLVRKILDWLTRPVDQADGPMEEPEKRSWTEAVSALFSVVHLHHWVDSRDCAARCHRWPCHGQHRRQLGSPFRALRADDCPFPQGLRQRHLAPFHRPQLL